jgi:transposase
MMMESSSTRSDAIMPTPAQHARLGLLAEALDGTPHGERGLLIEQAAAEFGVQPQTVHNWLKGHRATGRKRRADAGETALTRDEARIIAVYLQNGISGTGKKRLDLLEAVDWLRTNKMINATRIDEKTGEIIPLSRSAISRALRQFKLDAKSLATPAPYQPLSSPHPNWMWEVDASVCVIFYLPARADVPEGLALIDERDVYKNKPQNAKAIELFRVIRYVMTDHASGLKRWRYYPHAESGVATCDFLAWLMAKKPDLSIDPFHGRPKFVMVDPGATASGAVKRFCVRMGIELIVNAPHNARAKGQVEQGNNRVEKVFESGLTHVRQRVRDIADLNALAGDWQVWYNSETKHTRHKMTRFEAWMKIRPEELVETAPYARLRALIEDRVEMPLVKGDLSVRFDGKRYDVRDVPGIVIGKPLSVCASPFAATGAAALVEEDGRETLIPLEEITQVGEFGFPSNAAVAGIERKSMPDTIVEQNKKELLLLATGAKTLKDAEKISRRKDFQPFDGVMNPYKAAEDATPVVYLPRAATPMPDALPQVAARTFSVVDAAMRLRDTLGEDWNAETYEWLTRKYPDGIAETDLARIVDNMKGEANVIAM